MVLRVGWGAKTHRCIQITVLLCRANPEQKREALLTTALRKTKMLFLSLLCLNKRERERDYRVLWRCDRCFILPDILYCTWGLGCYVCLCFWLCCPICLAHFPLHCLSSQLFSMHLSDCLSALSVCLFRTSSSWCPALKVMNSQNHVTIGVLRWELRWCHLVSLIMNQRVWHRGGAQ